MTKKIAAKLTTLDTTVYSVLSPENGYLVIVHGEPDFSDNLPRASATYIIPELALAARDQAIELADTFVAKAVKVYEANVAKYGKTSHAADDYWVKKFTKIAELARAAIVVEVTVKAHSL